MLENQDSRLMNHLAEREVWMNLFKSQKSGDREKVRQQEALLKRQEQEKKEEEVLGGGDQGGGDHGDGDHGDRVQLLL